MAELSLDSYPWARLRALLWRFRTLDFAERTFGASPSPTIVRRRLFGFDAYLDLSRSNAHRLLYLDGERYIKERHLLAQLVRPGMHVVDVGANIGYYMLLLRRLVGPAGSVTCFEPEASNFAELDRNLHLNGLDNVRLVRAAVGAQDGEIPFLSGLNGVVTDAEGADDRVPIVRLDSAHTAMDRPPDMIKIDVEGYEGEVLEGARSLLSEHRPTLFLELHSWMLYPPHTVESIFELLASIYRRPRIFSSLPDHGLIEKIRQRYLSHASISTADPPDGDLTAATKGEAESLWVVCQPDE